MSNNVELFDKNLEISDELLRDIKFHIEMQGIAQKTAQAVNKLFQNEKDIDKLISVFEENITEYYGTALGDCEGYFLEQYEQYESCRLNPPFERQKIFKGFFSVFIEDYLSAVMSGEESLKQFKKSLGKYKEECRKTAYMDVYDWIPSIESEMIKQGIFTEVITPENEVQGEKLFNGLKNACKNGSRAYEIAFKLFETDPTAEEYYKFCMLQFPEQMVNLIVLYKLVGFTLSNEFLNTALNNLFKKMPHNNEKETLTVKKRLEEIQEVVDISQSNVVQKVDDLLKRFDIEARTFKNITFDTRELRHQAENDYNKLAEICKVVESEDEETCKQRKEWIENQNFIPEIAAMYIKKLDSRIECIWKAEDSEKLNAIFLNTDIYAKNSIEQSIQQIDSIGRTKDKERYIDALKGINEENLENIRKYKEWMGLSFLDKYGVSMGLVVGGIILNSFSEIGMLLLGVGIVFWIRERMKAGKLKKIWGLLTLNGEIIHPQLLQEWEGVKNGYSYNQNELSKQTYCPVCGKENAKDAKYCIHCGEKLETKM